MSYASKLKQNKETKISELEQNFFNILTLINKNDDLICDKYRKDPYMILVKYKDEIITITYNIYTQNILFSYEKFEIDLKNISYDLMVTNGIIHYIELLEQNKNNYINNIMVVLINKFNTNNNIKITYLDAINQNELHVTYKNQHNFILKISLVNGISNFLLTI